MGLTSSPRMRALSLIVDFTIMVSMFALDVRDLWYKTRWIGPSDSFSFAAVASQTLQPNVNLSSAATFNRSATAVGDELPRASGWSSFLATCDEVHPIADGPFFLHALGVNCWIGDRSSGHLVHQLIFTSSGRADAYAWAACRLLRYDRKPVVCRSPIVKDFASRYSIAESPTQIYHPDRSRSQYESVDLDDTPPPVVLPHSAAEDELIGLLDVISRSAPPLSRLTCVEGFAHVGPGHYVSSHFGCASATRFESAFVGHTAMSMASLLQNKAWLTSDVLHLIGMAYIIRQNSWSLFRVSTKGDSISVEHTTLVNFSSSGILYTFVVVVDTLLLVLNLVSTVEIASLVLVPLVRDLRASEKDRVVGSREAPFAFSDYKAILTCPLFRSGPIAVLMLVSQSLSWLLVLPNAVIWTWTESVHGKLQAYLSTLRIWVVPLILVNLSWNVFVFIAERRAYAVTRRAYLSVVEVLAIASLVAYLQRSTVFSIGSAKYALDTQRVSDLQSFTGFIAFGNGFLDSQDTVQTTAARFVAVIYQPLVVILGWTLLGMAGQTLLRFIVHALWRRATVGVAEDAVHAVEYRRLPIEVLLDLPIRARSLIRNSHEMETTVKGKRYLRPSCYVEHGIVMEHHKLRTRQGFFGAIRYSTDLARHAMPPSEAAKEGEGTEETTAATGHSTTRRRQVLRALH